MSRLELSTGAGKTLIATEIIRKLGVKTLFVVDKTELLNQAVTTLDENLGLEIGILGNGEKNIQNITVATIQTILKKLDFRSKYNVFKKSIIYKQWKKYVIDNNICKPEKPEDDEEDEDKNIQYDIALSAYQQLEIRFFKSYLFSIDEELILKNKTEEINTDIDKFTQYLQEIRFLIVDESHKSGAKSYFKLSSIMKNTEYRLGITGTDFREDGNDLMMHGILGNNVFSITGQELIDKGYLMKPKIIFSSLQVPKEYIKTMTLKSSLGFAYEKDEYSMFYPNFIVHNHYRNYRINKICEEHKGKTILILVKHVEHGKLLEKMISGSIYVYGETNKKLRASSLKDFKNNNLKILISTISIFGEGIDIPTLNVIINGAANRSGGRTIQVLGRVLRMQEGKAEALYYDFIDSYEFFINASKDRMKILKKEGYSIKIEKEECSELSLCSSCYCFTHTTEEGKCGKCKKDK